jgi:hypothetical protein
MTRSDDPLGGFVLGDDGHGQAAVGTLQNELLVAAGAEVIGRGADEDEPADDHEDIGEQVAGGEAGEVGGRRGGGRGGDG